MNVAEFKLDPQPLLVTRANRDWFPDAQGQQNNQPRLARDRYRQT